MGRTLSGVDSLFMWAASLLFPFGAPIKVCTTRFFGGLGGRARTQGCGCCPATLPSLSSSSELLAEKSGLAGRVIEDHEEGPGCSSSISSHA